MLERRHGIDFIAELVLGQGDDVQRRAGDFGIVGEREDGARPVEADQWIPVSLLCELPKLRESICERHAGRIVHIRMYPGDAAELDYPTRGVQ